MNLISIVAADTQNYDLTKVAIEKTLKSLPLAAKVMTFSDRPFFPGADHVNIPTFSSNLDYNNFVLKELGKYVTTEFCLIVQYDGFAINTAMWSEEYLNYDYIGAPIDKGRIVGNGGFSLRSKKLLDALMDPAITLLPDRQFGKNEDRVICDYFKEYLETNYGIKFAPTELAQYFSFEKGKCNNKPFGFHGVWNIPKFCSEDDSIKMLSLISWKKRNALDSTIKVAESKGYKSLLEMLKNIQLN